VKNVSWERRSRRLISQVRKCCIEYQKHSVRPSLKARTFTSPACSPLQSAAAAGRIIDERARMNGQRSDAWWTGVVCTAIYGSRLDWHCVTVVQPSVLMRHHSRDLTPVHCCCNKPVIKIQ